MIRVRKEGVVNTKDAAGKIIKRDTFPYVTFVLEPTDEPTPELFAEIDALAASVEAGTRADAICEDGDGTWMSCDQATAKETDGKIIRNVGWRAAFTNGCNLLFRDAASPTQTTRLEDKRSAAMDVVLPDNKLRGEYMLAKKTGGLKAANVYLEAYYDAHLATVA